MERIGSGVERELARRTDGRAPALAAATEVWQEVVGPAVSQQSWPLRLGRDGTLHVATSSATWAFELDRLGGEILARLAQRIGPDAPTALRFAAGPLPEPATASETSAATEPPPVKTSPEVQSEAASAAAAIEDPELRALAERAARASIRKARSGRRV